MSTQIAVVGLGKIGLPIAAYFATNGCEVVGIDIDQHAVSVINSGEVPFPGEPELPSMLKKVVSEGNFRATADYSDGLRKAEIILVAVPLLTDKDDKPVFKIVDSAAQSIGENIKKGAVVIFETTLPVGTTRNRIARIISEASGLREGSDFFAAFSPERVFTGRVFEDLRRYPKIVGGVSAEAGRKAVEFYEQHMEFDQRDDLQRPNGVWLVANSETAELVKLMETTYRDVNIALANEFSNYAERVGLNVYEAIESANSQPFSHIHRPGVSVGGHCIPVYPMLYAYTDDQCAVVQTARDVNQGMPQRTARRAIDAMGEKEAGASTGRKALILGLAYRGGVKEDAKSGCYGLHQEFITQGFDVYVHDPLYSDQEITDRGMKPESQNDRSVPYDIAVIHTDHAEYREITTEDYGKIHKVVDGRNILRSKPSDTQQITLGISAVLANEGQN